MQCAKDKYARRQNREEMRKYTLEFVNYSCFVKLFYLSLH